MDEEEIWVCFSLELIMEKIILMMYLCLIGYGLRPKRKKRERGPKAMDLKSWLENLKWARTDLFSF